MGDKPTLIVTFNTTEEFAREWEKNISKGGIFVKTDAPVASRQPVNVVIEIKDSRSKLELAGEAVHVSNFGVGVQLNPMPDNVRDKIQALMLPKPTDEETAPDIAEASDTSLYQNIQNMTRQEKLALARKGGMDARAMLMRDRDPQVVMSVILNPRLTMSEVIQLSSSQSLTLDMVKQILNKPEWLSNESVLLNLVLNPKTPLPTAVNLLPRLSERNIRMLAKRPIRQQLKQAALKIIVPK